MGRPRKRRRDDQSPKNPIVDSAEVGPEVDGGVVSMNSTMPGTLEAQFPSQDPNFSIASLEELNGNFSSGTPLPDLFSLQTDDMNIFPGLDPYGPDDANDFRAEDLLATTSDRQRLENHAINLLDGDDLSIRSLTNPMTSSDSSCPCIASLYVTLSSFQALPPPSFPYSMGALAKATTVAREALRCQRCPKMYALALQNLMSLCTLLPLIAHQYGKLLQYIDERSAEGRPINVRMGEKSMDQLHLHTGTADCPMAFDLQLSANEWRAMSRKVVRRKVIGDADSDDSLLRLVEELENRQRAWHANPVLPEFKHSLSCMEHTCPSSGEHLCLQMICRARKAIEHLGLEDEKT